jgi:hypothetical protein
VATTSETVASVMRSILIVLVFVSQIVACSFVTTQVIPVDGIRRGDSSETIDPWVGKHKLEELSVGLISMRKLPGEDSYRAFYWKSSSDKKIVLFALGKGRVVSITRIEDMKNLDLGIRNWEWTTGYRMVDSDFRFLK